MPPGTILFVYGTLKRGGANHDRLADQTFLGVARTRPGMTLYSLGEYPGLVRASDDLDGVTGELWAVDDAALARLDEFEGVHEGLYAREPAPLAETPEGLGQADVRRAQLYRYLREVKPEHHIGSTWPV